MVKLAKQRRSKRYGYSVNRKRKNQKAKKKVVIQDEVLKKAWNDGKGIHFNMTSMGLSADANMTLAPANAKPATVGKDRQTKREEVPDKTNVLATLEERAAAIPSDERARLSEPEAQYAIYMMEKYDDDYKAMARDRRNYYQDTPKQIKRKIENFKTTKRLYEPYMILKELEDHKATT